MQKFGDYVKYEPDTGTFNFSSVEPTTKETYNSLVGGTTNGSFTTDQFNWRILDINEENDKLTIVADGVTTGNLELKGAMGYNNGVGVLNLVGHTCYSNQKLNAIGRSINLEDIDKLFKTSIERYRTVTCNTSTTSVYPFIHAMEEYSNVNNELLLPGSQWTPGEKVWRVSEQKRFIKSESIDGSGGTVLATNKIQSLVFKKNKYFYTGSSIDLTFKSTIVKDIITKIFTDGNFEDYWAATRFSRSPDAKAVRFGLMYVTSSGISLQEPLKYEDNSEPAYSYRSYLRPVVDISLSETILGTSRKWTYRYSMDIIIRLRKMESSKVKLSK